MQGDPRWFILRCVLNGVYGAERRLVRSIIRGFGTVYEIERRECGYEERVTIKEKFQYPNTSTVLRSYESSANVSFYDNAFGLSKGACRILISYAKSEYAYRVKEIDKRAKEIRKQQKLEDDKKAELRMQREADFIEKRIEERKAKNK